MSARSDAYDVIRRDALAGIERRRLQPDRELTEIHAEVERAVDEYQRRARLGEELALGDPGVMVQRVLRSVTDYGALTELLARRDVEEIFVEGPRVTYLDGGGRLRGLAEPTSEDENRQMIDRLLATTERQLNTKQPLVQARVLDGTARLTAAIAPIADRLSATLRRYTVRDATLHDLVARDTLSPEAATFLWAVMQVRSRLTVSGQPGAGKTTLLAALLASIPAAHCVRCCEEIREVAVPVAHGAFYEVRPPGLDGSGEIDLRALVKFVLAMRPDVIVVGEVRGAEAFELTRAVNAGCGFLCTVHSNSAGEAVNALVNAALMAGENVTERIVRKVFGEALDLVVQLDRDDAASGSEGRIRRQVMEITAVAPTMTDDQTYEPIFVRPSLGRPLEWTGTLPSALEQRVDRSLPNGTSLRTLLERAEVGGAVRLLAALCVGTSCALLAAAIAGVLPSPRPRRRPRRTDRAGHLRVWLQQAGVGLTPRQFVGACAGVGAFAFILLAALTGSFVVAVVPALAVALVPRVYFGHRRVVRMRAVLAAWPDGLRDLLASISAGRSLTQAVTALAASGPPTLRVAFARFPELARVLGTGPALEIVKEELSDATSDRILEVLILAHERGGGIVRTILEDLVDATTKDLKLLEELETESLEMRIDAHAVVVLPWLVLVVLTVRPGAFRDFYRSGGGLVTVLIAAILSIVGVLVLGRLGREPGDERVFPARGGGS